MSLDEIFESYSNKMTQLSLYQRAVKGIAEKELKKIIEYEKSLKKYPELKGGSMHSMTFRSAEYGERIFYGYKEISLKDKHISILLHKNKQYQWLLSEAYEEFEDCIERLYAYAGFTNLDYWALEDFGSISLCEIKNKNFNWFVLQAAKKNGAPASILKNLENHFLTSKKLKRIIN